LESTWEIIRALVGWVAFARALICAPSLFIRASACTGYRVRDVFACVTINGKASFRSERALASASVWIDSPVCAREAQRVAVVVSACVLCTRGTRVSESVLQWVSTSEVVLGSGFPWFVSPNVVACDSVSFPAGGGRVAGAEELSVDVVPVADTVEVILRVTSVQGASQGAVKVDSCGHGSEGCNREGAHL
jgi:hypothetical protein